MGVAVHSMNGTPGRPAFLHRAWQAAAAVAPQEIASKATVVVVVQIPLASTARQSLRLTLHFCEMRVVGGHPAAGVAQLSGRSQ
jgi:hypothetical protein